MYAFAIVFEDSLFEFTTSSKFSGPPPATAVVVTNGNASHDTTATNKQKEYVRQ